MDKKSILIGYVNSQFSSSKEVCKVTLSLKRANRHGLIAGATGTGKTVTLQALAEGFSASGVPVFLVDVKGDVSGISQAGKSHPKILERLDILGLPSNGWRGFPTIFWDLYGRRGHPVRATIADMGLPLLVRLLGLSDTQQGMLDIAFAVADDQNLPLIDLKDLRAILQHISDNASDLRKPYGNVSSSSIGAVQRRLLRLERSGANTFFGEPMLDIRDLMKVNNEGLGCVSILSASELVREPAVYSTLLLWLLSKLFEELPEIGDPEKPKLVMFFDEAHLMFKDAPKALVDKVEQIVRLIRSKGVGVYFVTQSPSDIPDKVLSQLSNRFQHALRAFTPKDQKSVKVAADTFRTDGNFSVQDAIRQMKVGEALVSTLMQDGSPSCVSRVFIKPPISRIGSATEEELALVKSGSPVSHKYEDVFDRVSAFEILEEKEDMMLDDIIRQTEEEATERFTQQNNKGKSKGILRTPVSSIFRALLDSLSSILI